MTKLKGQIFKNGGLRAHTTRFDDKFREFNYKEMITLDEALTEIKRNKRICPLPQKWIQLYEMLPNRKRKGAGWEPALPLILAAWWETPALQKMLRLQEHIEWAAKHDCLDRVYSFLCELSEEDWFHIGDTTT